MESLLGQMEKKKKKIILFYFFWNWTEAKPPKPNITVLRHWERESGQGPACADDPPLCKRPGKEYKMP